MTEQRFVYDYQLLKDCATSDLAAYVVNHDVVDMIDATAEKMSDNNSCIELFDLHALHYGRQHSSSESRVDRIEIDDDVDEVTTTTTTTTPSNVKFRYDVGNRIEAFIKNVVFVYNHNNNNRNNNDDANIHLYHLHQVGLNRFSDMNPDEIFDSSPVSSSSSKTDGILKDENSGDDSRQGRRRLVVDENDFNTYRDWTFDGSSTTTATTTSSSIWNKLFKEESNVMNVMSPSPLEAGIITHLTDRQAIVDAAAALEVNRLAIGHGSMHALKPKKYKKLYDHSKVLEIPPESPPGKFENPGEIDDPHLDGSILSIKHKKPSVAELDDDEDEEDDGTGVTEDENSTSENGTSSAPEEDEFAKHLNWATSENPDGVPIVHEAFDQLTCGSCWAFAAAGSLEASASRRVAHDALRKYMRKSKKKKKKKNRVRATTTNDSNSTETDDYQLLADAAIAYAQRAQHDSFQMLNLSVQELVDCDTGANEGCTGGNPLLSFYFIHRYGLSSWEQYPYVGQEEECHEDWIHNPVATVKSWGVISPNHENHMELVLRYIGPIAVGVNGATHSFLAYTGGIFDDPTCSQGANHALLITGYGQEVAESGKVKKFWYARNSWGVGWGEGGYVRVKRGHGHKGEPGLCGIARSPSVALGGVLLKHDQQLAGDSELSITLTGPQERLCDSLGLGSSPACLKTVAWVSNNKALSAGLTGAFIGLIAIFLLAGDCRKRHRRSQVRAMKRKVEQDRLQASMLEQEDMESSALLDSIVAQGGGSYGTNGVEPTR